MVEQAKKMFQKTDITHSGIKENIHTLYKGNILLYKHILLKYKEKGGEIDKNIENQTKKFRELL